MTNDLNDALKTNRDWEKEKIYSLSNSDFSKVMYDAESGYYPCLMENITNLNN